MAQFWKEDYFTTWDGRRLFYRLWDHPAAKKTVILFHGYGEHSGRYTKFSHYFGDQPFRFAIMDYRGMGRSDGERASVASFEDYLKDVTSFIGFLKSQDKIQRPLILLGHSFGALVAVNWAVQHQDQIQALILSAPFFDFTLGEPGRWINAFVFGLWPDFIYKNPIHSAALTHDPEELRRHREDPLILREISSRLVREISKQIVAVKKTTQFSFSFPVYLLLAGKEKIVSSQAARRFFAKIQAPKKQLIEFSGFYHEIFNEREQEKTFNVLKTIFEGCV